MYMRPFATRHVPLRAQYTNSMSYQSRRQLPDSPGTQSKGYPAVTHPEPCGVQSHACSHVRKRQGRQTQSLRICG